MFLKTNSTALVRNIVICVYLCMSVCPSVRSHISITKRLNFTKLSVLNVRLWLGFPFDYNILGLCGVSSLLAVLYDRELCVRPVNFDGLSHLYLN